MAPTMIKPLFFTLCLLCSSLSQAQSALILQSDFGTADGAVAAMKGVAYQVSNQLDIFDLSHDIEPYNIWQGAYRLHQAAPYWPRSSVFVSVVDPGVGSQRKSVVLKTKTGHYFVSPDNGSLTLVALHMGVDEVRVIDENKHRLSSSKLSHTFHGRDVYAYTGAKLASGAITFDQVGPSAGKQIFSLQYQKPNLSNDIITGNIDILDIRYGNVWSNIPQSMIEQTALQHGDMLCVTFSTPKNQHREQRMPFSRSFADVAKGEPLAYLNSLLNLSFALNQDSFAKQHALKAGPDWQVRVKKCQ